MYNNKKKPKETLQSIVEQKLQILRSPENHQNKAFLTRTADMALKAAEEADQRYAQDKRLGPLDGCVVSIKDVFDMAGYVTTAGAVARQSFFAAQTDAPAIARLKNAGAIIIGRTTMSEFAFSGVGINTQFGTPGNPYDLTRICGGSSSGAAASVGYGICDIGLGSDTGGSVRIPAALCGLTGFKPTSGVVPVEGTFALSTTLDTVGPIAKTVSECAQTFAILTGQNLNKTQVLNKRSLAEYRIGIVRNDAFYEQAEPIVIQATKDAERILCSAGLGLYDVDVSLPLHHLAQLDHMGFFPSIELAASIYEYSSEKIGQIDPNIWARIKTGYQVSATSYINMLAQRRAMIAEMDAIMADYDALVLPTVPITAPKISALADEETFRNVNALLLRNTRFANIMDLPSVSLPLPTSGLPVGLMLWGRRYQDIDLLATSFKIEETIANFFV